jgi:ubiquitin-like-conjugating enzyme ATG10
MDQTSEFENYPFLTSEEFAEACHHLDRRYCQATLGPVRRQWKLRLCWALNTTSLNPGAEYDTYLQIIRPLDGELDDGDLSAVLEGFSFDQIGKTARHDVEPDVMEEDEAMREAEDADEVGTCLASSLYYSRRK